MTSRMPNREFVTTSIRVERDLLERFRAHVNETRGDGDGSRRGPRSFVGEALREHMRQTVDEAEAA